MKKDLTLLLLLLLGACSLSPDYEPPAIAVPEGWRNSTGAGIENARLGIKWWENFNSPTLNQLVEKALTKNNDIQASLARIRQARASAKIAGSNLYPSLDASANVRHARTDPGSGASTSGESWSTGASLSYELDLFGRNRDATEAAGLRAEASEYDFDSLALVVSGDMTTAYASLRTLEERITIAEKNLKNIRDVLAIIQARFNAGAVSALELAQQKASVATSEASIAELKRQRESFRSQIAILTGETPQNFDLDTTKQSGLALPQAVTFSPRNVLDNRPDIRKSEASLKAANLDIGQARAAFFPRLTLGLDTALSASPLSAPISLASSLASALTAPIFRGGELEGGVELAEAKKEEGVASYRQTVLNAFGEVDEALSALDTARRRTTSFETAARESRAAYTLARQRYQAGATDFQELLNAQRDVLNAEDTLAQVQLLRITTTTDLYKALGGGRK
jgi:multidrug efflux system outer membrane protein